MWSIENTTQIWETPMSKYRNKCGVSRLFSRQSCRGFYLIRTRLTKASGIAHWAKKPKKAFATNLLTLLMTLSLILLYIHPDRWHWVPTVLRGLNAEIPIERFVVFRALSTTFSLATHIWKLFVYPQMSLKSELWAGARKWRRTGIKPSRDSINACNQKMISLALNKNSLNTDQSSIDRITVQLSSVCIKIIFSRG